MEVMEWPWLCCWWCAGISRNGERALQLGLPLAKQFVEAHRGTIELVSEPGQGTMVVAELPRA